MRTVSIFGTSLLLCLAFGCLGDGAGSSASGPSTDVKAGQPIPREFLDKGDVEAVRECLDNGASIEALDALSKVTPLMIAIAMRQDGVVDLLLERGADVNNGCLETPLQSCIILDNWRVGRRLVDAGASVKDSSDGGTYALGHAAHRGENRWVNYLLDQGADVNAIDKFGDTALHLACAQRKESTVKLLLDRGARIDLVGAQNRAALHAAAKSGSLECVRLLTAAGADLNRATKTYLETPLMVAVQARQTEVVQFLLEQGANPAAVDDKGRTALDRARKRNEAEFVEILEKASPTVPGK